MIIKYFSHSITRVLSSLETVETDLDVDDSEDSRSRSHDDSSDGDRSKSRGSDGDHRSRTGGRHEGSEHGNSQEIVVDILPCECIHVHVFLTTHVSFFTPLTFL